MRLPARLRPVVLAAAVAPTLLATGCITREPGLVDPLRLRSFAFEIDPGSNGNRPVRVDLVRTRDGDLARELAGIDTKAWFGGDGDAFRSTHPQLTYDTWELVPGVDAGPFDLRRGGIAAGFLFCDTESAPPPLRLARDGDVTVEIDDDGCAVTGGDIPFIERLALERVVRLSFDMPAGANRGRPVRVELVRVRDPSLVPALTRFANGTWFGGARRAFRRDHPDVEIDDWELVPGASYGPFRFAVRRKVSGVLFCATSVGTPLALDWEGHLKVEVDDYGCRLAGDAPTTTEPDNTIGWSAWR